MTKVLHVATIPLVVIHILILYYWIFDWRQLVTKVGLVSWIGSIVLGVIFYLLYRRDVTQQRLFQISRKVLFSTTLMTVLLGFFALMIEFMTRSMP